MEMLEDLLDLILPDDEISYRYLQPEPSLLSTNYNGWKGVLRWCSRSCDEIIKANDSILPGLDLLIIQIDGMFPEMNRTSSHIVRVQKQAVTLADK